MTTGIVAIDFMFAVIGAGVVVGVFIAVACAIVILMLKLLDR